MQDQIASLEGAIVQHSGGAQRLMCSLTCLGSGCVAAGLSSDVNPSRRSLGALEANDKLRPLLVLSMTACGGDLNVSLAR